MRLHTFRDYNGLPCGRQMPMAEAAASRNIKDRTARDGNEDPSTRKFSDPEQWRESPIRFAGLIKMAAGF